MFVLKDGNITEVQVETGISSDSETEITSGLSVGDTIVTSSSSQSTGSASQSQSPFSSIL